MTRTLIRTDEAEWQGLYRVWAHVQQYSPRRGKLSGHLVAVLVGLTVAAIVVAIQGAAR